MARTQDELLALNEQLEERVRERTTALEADITERQRAEAHVAEQLNELRRWHDAMVGREGRALELKKEVNDLLAQLGQPPRYPSALEGLEP